MKCLDLLEVYGGSMHSRSGGIETIGMAVGATYRNSLETMGGNIAGYHLITIQYYVSIGKMD